jgi:hypothetical protein
VWATVPFISGSGPRVIRLASADSDAPSWPQWREFEKQIKMRSIPEAPFLIKNPNLATVIS